MLLKDGGLWKRSWKENEKQKCLKRDLFIIGGLPFCILLISQTAYLDEDIDVVCDLESHHFDLVLNTHNAIYKMKF